MIHGQQQTFNYSHTTPDTQCYINSFLLSNFARHRAIWKADLKAEHWKEGDTM